MAHFAQIDENGKVIQVTVVSNDDCNNLPFPASESVGQQFIASLGIGGVWIQTSYNNNFRRRYAAVGAVHMKDTDTFTVGQPYPSWSLGEDGEWLPPKPRPTPDGEWLWDEATQEWYR